MNIQTSAPEKIHRFILWLLLGFQVLAIVSVLSAYYVWSSPAYWVQSGYDYRLSEKVKESKPELVKEWHNLGGHLDASFFSRFSPADVKATGPWWEALIPFLCAIITCLILKELHEQKGFLSEKTTSEFLFPQNNTRPNINSVISDSGQIIGYNQSTLNVLRWTLRRGRILLAIYTPILLLVCVGVYINNVVKSPPIHSGQSRNMGDEENFRWTYAMNYPAWWSIGREQDPAWTYSGDCVRPVNEHRYEDVGTENDSIFWMMYKRPQIPNSIYSVVNFGMSAPLLAFYLVLMGICTTKSCRQRLDKFRENVGEPQSSLKEAICHVTKTVLHGRLKYYSSTLSDVLKFWFSVWMIFCVFATCMLLAPPTVFFSWTLDYTWTAFFIVALSGILAILLTIIGPYYFDIWRPLEKLRGRINRDFAQGAPNDCSKYEIAVADLVKAHPLSIFPKSLINSLSKLGYTILPLILKYTPFN